MANKTSFFTLTLLSIGIFNIGSTLGQTATPQNNCSFIRGQISPGGELNWKVNVGNIGSNDDLLDVIFETGTRGWASSQGAIFRTEDGGKSWSKLKYGAPRDFFIAGIKALSPGHLWLVLEKSHYDVEKREIRLMYSSDAGRSWRLQFHKKSAFGGTLLAEDAGRIWFALNAYPPLYGLIVLASNDYGKNWQDYSSGLMKQVVPSSTGSRSRLTNVFRVGNDIAVINHTGEMFLNSGKSENWTESISPCLRGSWAFGDLSGVDWNGRLWLGKGSDGFEGPYGAVAFQESDGEWRFSSIQGFVLADVLLLRDRAILVAGSLDKKGSILRSKDNGKTWKIVYQNDRIKYVNKLTASEKDSIWAAGNNGFLALLNPR